MTIEKRALHGTMIGVVGFGATMLQSIMVVPFLLREWGGATYGAWVALQAFVALVTTVDSGHAENIGNECQQLIFTNKPIDEVFGSGLAVALGLSGVELCVVLGLGAAGLVPRCLGMAPGATGYAQAAVSAVALVSASAFATVPNGLFIRLFQPHGRFVRAQVWGIVLRLATALVLITAVAAGCGILGAAVFVAVATFAFQTASTVDSSRLFGVRPRVLLQANLRTGLRGFWRSLMRTGAIYLGQAHISGLTIVLAAVVGPTEVAAFATTRTIVSALMQGANIVAMPLTPEMIRFRATNDWTRLRAALRGMWFVGGTIMNLAVVCVLPIVAAGYHVWTRGVFELDRVLFGMLALSACVRASGIPIGAYLGGINHTRFLLSSAAAQGTVSISCAFATVGTFGIRGAAFAVLAGEISGMLVVPCYEYSRDRRESGQTSAFPDVVFAAAPLLVIGAVLSLFALSSLPPMWLAPCSLVAIAVAHGFQWRHLPDEVKGRILGQLISRLRKKA